MNNWTQATPERGRGRAQRGRLTATSPPILLALSVLLLWPLAHADGQSFAFNPISPRTTGVGSTLTLTLSVAPVPPTGVFFGHGGAAPADSFPTNAILDAISGAFVWLPNTNQLGANSITVWAVEQLNPANSNYTTFTVIVTNAAASGGVVIDTILPQTVAEGTMLIFTNHAHATDNPANALVFSLVDAPSGATITNNTPTSGVFTWTPTSAQALNPFYTIREIVTEPGTSGSNYQDFQVTVTRTNNCAQLDAFLAAVEQGGYFLLSNCTAIVLSSPLTISTSVTLDAGTNNVTIAGNNLFRLFNVLPGVVNFTLRGITLSGGQDASGGAMYIAPGAQVLVTNCLFAGNGAVGANGVAGNDGNSGGNNGQNGGNGTAGTQALGGAIYNLGILTVLNSQFLTNRATGGSGGSGGSGGDGVFQGGNGGSGGAGALGHGGAIYNLGTLRLTNCTFSGNTASGGSAGEGGAGGAGAFVGYAGRGGAGATGSGAAVYSAQSVTVVNCTFSSNAARSGDSTAGGTDSSGNGMNGPRGPDSFGGGIFSQGSGTLVNCTLYNNTAAGGNGGNGGDADPSGIHTAGNGGNGGNGTGGGIYNTGTVAVVNCTFSSCGATGGTNGVAGSAPFPPSDGTPGRGRGGDIAQGYGYFVLQNSILAASLAGTNAYDTSTSRITDGGFNISSDASLNLSGTSRKNTDPKVGSLASNGGPTQTIALQSGSPAIDAVPPVVSSATDQRGVARPQGAACDVGAYELVTLPAILIEPQSQTNANGTRVTLTVSALGDSLGYQWRFNAAAIASATGPNYTIASVDATNGGTYDVVISNIFGAVTSAPATLTIIFPPSITTQPASLSVLRGSNAIFTVQATGLVPLHYQWQFNSTDISAATTTSYTVMSAQAGDAGSYTVVITNLQGRIISAPAILTVNVPPFITAPPLSQAVTPGSNVTFTVVAAGTLPLSYQWRFNGTNIVGAMSSAYVIASAQATNAGTYDVVIANNYGFTSSPPASLYVVQPFAISGRVLDVNGTSGLPGVLIQAITNSAVAATTSSDANGNYLISGLDSNLYAVVASAACYLFNPSATNVTVGPTNGSGIFFHASNDFHAIRGHVTNSAGDGVGNVLVSTGGTNMAVTDVTGSYVLSNLCAGAYAVAPSANCYTFTPSSVTVSVGPGDTNGINYLAASIQLTISGRITDGGIGVAGVSVQAGNQTTNTDSSGNYVLFGLCPGSYTVIPSQGCRLFNPSSIAVTLGPNTGGVNFVTFSNNLSRIRGQITDGVIGLGNVPVALTGSLTSRATTDSNGDYAFSSLCPGTYTVTPSVTNRCLNAQSLTVTLGSAQTTNGVDFVATPAQYHISGTLAGMPPGPSVAVRIAGPSGTNVLFTSTGAYGISNLCPGAYTVTPSNACYQFYPSSQTTTLGPSDDGLNFAVSGVSSFSIGGRVTHNGVPLSNVTITAAGQTNTTDASGNYILPYLCPGSYAVTASAPNFLFNPPANYVTLSTADSNGVNFAAVAVLSLSGRVVQGASGLPGVKVAVGTNISYTGAGGYYTNLNLREGANVLVVPSLDAYAFAPASQSVTVQSNTSGVDFMAFPSLALARASNGVVQLAFAPAFTCQVEVSTNFSNWQLVFATNDISTSTLLLEFTDTNAANLPLRFYRVAETFGGPLVLTNLTATNRSVSFGCVAAPVVACQIQASTNLRSWTNIFSTNLPAAALLRFGYHDATDLPARFYRLSQTPGF